MIGFVAAAMSFWGVVVPGMFWMPVAASAVVSMVGIALFVGSWPVFSTLAATVMDVAVLAALLWFVWPLPALFGN